MESKVFFKPDNEDDWEVEDECKKCSHYYIEDHDEGTSHITMCKNPDFDSVVLPSRISPCRGFKENICHLYL